MFKKCLLYLTVGGIVSIASGCTTIDFKKNNTRNSNVRASLSGNMFDEFKCIREELLASPAKPSILMVERIIDGTVKEGSGKDGALSDSGAIQLKSTLVELIPSTKGAVMNTVPAIFRTENGGSINEYGSIDGIKYKKFSSLWASNLGANPSPFLINGEFTRFDGDQKTHQKSNGFNFGNDGSDGDGDAKIGFANGKGSISLTINIVSPVNQLILTTQSFTADVTADKKEVSVRLGPGEGALGYSYAVEESLTPHEVQQHLIDISAIWIVNKIYSDVMPSVMARQCIAEKQLSAITDINVEGE